MTECAQLVQGRCLGDRNVHIGGSCKALHYVKKARERVRETVRQQKGCSRFRLELVDGIARIRNGNPELGAIDVDIYTQYGGGDGRFCGLRLRLHVQQRTKLPRVQMLLPPEPMTT